MILQAETQKVYTPDEYLDLEVDSDWRHEYIDGEIVQMTGETPNHNQIALNLSGSLNFALKRQPYRVFVTDQRLWIPRKTIYTYPDVMVTSGNLQFQEGRKDTILNPIFIAEVLSPSTRGYDKTDKFSAYRTISTFREYLLIEQSQIHVEHYVKNDRKRWMFLEYDEAEEVIVFNSIDFQISLTDLYDRVEFDSEID